MEKTVDVLEEMIERVSKAPLDKNSASDIQFFEKSVRKIFNCTNEEYKNKLGKWYEQVDFSFFNENSNTIGGYISNVQNRNGKVVKLNKNNSIIVNTYIYLSESFFASKDEEVRKKACVKVIDTMRHEFRHYYQNMLRQNNKIYYKSIESSKQDIMTKTQYKDIYNNNYRFMFDEIDARLKGYEQTLNIINSIKDKNKVAEYTKYLNSTTNYEVDNLLNNTYMFSEGDKGAQDKEKFFNQRVDKYVKDNPEILNLYGCLKAEYNDDGTPKSGLQLLKDYKEKLKTIKDNNNTPEQKKRDINELRETTFSIFLSRLEDLSFKENKELENYFGKEGNGGTKKFYELLAQYNKKIYEKKSEEIDKIEKLQLEKNGLTDKQKQSIKDSYYEVRKVLEEKHLRKYERIRYYYSSVKQNSQDIINGVDITLVAPKRLNDKQQDKKNKVIEEMIDTYSKLESAEDFSKRETTEDRNFSMIVNAIKTR